MFDINRVLIDGLTVSIPFALVVWISWFTKPRLWLHSLPDDIQAMAPPKTPREKQLTIFMGVFIMATFFGGPILLTWRWNLEQNGLPFRIILVHLYSVWLIVNVWDLLLIDWLFTTFVNPQKPPIAGTEGAAGWKNYRFHLYAGLKASIFSLFLIVPAAALISLA